MRLSCSKTLSPQEGSRVKRSACMFKVQENIKLAENKNRI